MVNTFSKLAYLVDIFYSEYRLSFVDSLKVPELVQYFSTVGEVKVDRNSKQPRVHLYKDKATGEPLGEATITYKDNQTQRTALETYNNQMYQVTHSVTHSSYLHYQS